MKDNRCNEKLIREAIDTLKADIESYKDVLEHVKGDEDFHKVYAAIINRRFYILRHGYMLGNDLNQLREEYLEISNDLKKIDYLAISNDIVNILSLAILFEDSIENIKTIVKLGDICEENDIVFDYLANGCGIKRTFNSKYFQDDDNKVLTEIIKLSKVDNKKASERFVNYIENEFAKNTWGEDWTGDVRKDFYGVCLFSYSAIAKILNLDDSKLKDNPHYPYELSHYKNEMKFFPEETGDMFKNYKRGISEYRELEKVVPVQFHEEVNRNFLDHKNLSDEEFYEKYNIHHVSREYWDLEQFSKYKNEPYLLGFLVVCALANNGYFFEFDCPSEFEEDEIYNFWEDIEEGIDVKSVNFNVDNGTYFVAYIPSNVEIDSILDINVENFKGFDKYNLKNYSIDENLEEFVECTSKNNEIDYFFAKIKVKQNKSKFSLFKKKFISQKNLFKIIKKCKLWFGSYNDSLHLEDNRINDFTVSVFNPRRIGRGIFLDFKKIDKGEIILGCKLPTTPAEINNFFDIIRGLKYKCGDIEIYSRYGLEGEFEKQNQDELFGLTDSLVDISLRSLREICANNEHSLHVLALFPYLFSDKQKELLKNSIDLKEYENLLHNFQSTYYYYPKPKIGQASKNDDVVACYTFISNVDSVFPINCDTIYSIICDCEISNSYISFCIREEKEFIDGIYLYDDFIKYVLSKGAEYFYENYIIVKGMSKAEIIKMSECLKKVYLV